MIFECTRCGCCCKKPVGPMQGHVHGLMIFPSERHLFPEKIVKPMLRYSQYYELLPGYIFMYQVDAEPCPHYDEGCNIYSKRPTICQVFPFEPRGEGGVAMHESCKEIERLLASGYKPPEVRITKQYLAPMLNTMRFWDKWLVTKHIERYDIKEEKWAFILDGAIPLP